MYKTKNSNSTISIAVKVNNMKKTILLFMLIACSFSSVSFAKEVKYATKLYNSYSKEYYSVLNRPDSRQMHPSFTHARPRNSAIIWRDDMRVSRTTPIERCTSLAARMIDERIELICIDKKEKN